jgi:hypothetical protein
MDGQHRTERLRFEMTLAIAAAEFAVAADAAARERVFAVLRSSDEELAAAALAAIVDQLQAATAAAQSSDGSP